MSRRYRKQPKTVSIQHPVPDLAHAFAVDIFMPSTIYDGDPLGRWMFNHKTHRVEEKKSAHIALTVSSWKSPGSFDRAVLRIFDRAAARFELRTNLALAYRLQWDAFHFPNKKFNVICHPSNTDAIKRYYVSENIGQFFPTKSCRKNLHYVTPLREYLGVLLSSNNFEEYNVMISPRMIVKVDHVVGYKASMDSFTKDTEEAIQLLLSTNKAA